MCTPDVINSRPPRAYKKEGEATWGSSYIVFLSVVTHLKDVARVVRARSIPTKNPNNQSRNICVPCYKNCIDILLLTIYIQYKIKNYKKLFIDIVCPGTVVQCDREETLVTLGGTAPTGQHLA